MGALVSICNTTAQTFMFVLSLFNVLFFVAVYLVSGRYKSLLFIMIANIIKHLSSALIFLNAYDNYALAAATKSTLSVLTMTFMILAALNILNIKIKVWPFIFFNVITLAQGIYFELMGVQTILITSITAYIIALMFVYAVILISSAKDKTKHVRWPLLIFAISFFVVFHAARGAIYMLGYFDMLVDKVAVIKMVTILSFGVFHFLNLLIIYINYAYLIIKIRELSHKDKLTGALNRTIFLEMLDIRLKELKRTKEGFTLAIIDLDDFKQVNDIYGHLAGDEVLKGVVKHIKERLRAHDLICRYGGEEFLLLMEASDIDEAKAIVERIQNSARELRFTDDDIAITFSCGLEFVEDHNGGTEINEIIKIIDDRLYEAKHAGKDCLV